MATFHLYEGIDGKYYWHLKASNGEKVCWAEGYSSRQNALKSIEFVRQFARDAKFEDHTLSRLILKVLRDRAKP